MIAAQYDPYERLTTPSQWLREPTTEEVPLGPPLPARRPRRRGLWLAGVLSGGAFLSAGVLSASAVVVALAAVLWVGIA